MFIKLHSVLFDETSLKHSEIILLSYFLDCGYEEIQMTNEKLASITGLSPRTVSRAVNSLAKQEYIKVTYGSLDKSYAYHEKVRQIKTAVRIEAGDSIDNYYMYNPLWKKEMGLTTGEAVVLAFFNSICRVRKSATVSGFPVKDICDTLRLSYRIVSNAIQNLNVMGLLTHKRAKDSRHNEYTLSVPFAKAETKDQLFDAFLDNRELKDRVEGILQLKETWLFVRGAIKRNFWERLDRRVNMGKYGEAWIRYSGGVRVA